MGEKYILYMHYEKLQIADTYFKTHEQLQIFEEILRFTVCWFMSTFCGFHIQPVLHWL